MPIEMEAKEPVRPHQSESEQDPELANFVRGELEDASSMVVELDNDNYQDLHAPEAHTPSHERQAYTHSLLGVGAWSSETPHISDTLEFERALENALAISKES